MWVRVFACIQCSSVCVCTYTKISETIRNSRSSITWKRGDCIFGRNKTVKTSRPYGISKCELLKLFECWFFFMIIVVVTVTAVDGCVCVSIFPLHVRFYSFHRRVLYCCSFIIIIAVICFCFFLRYVEMCKFFGNGPYFIATKMCE